jgi:cytochrome c oxidase cbb3-type subunit IV
MIKNVIEHLDKVDTYGVISIVLFFTFFVSMLLWAFRLKKGYLNSMSALPLDGGESAGTSNQIQNDPSHE